MKSIFSRHILMVSLALIAAITIQLISPAIVRADDGTTPSTSEEQTTSTEEETLTVTEEPQAVDPVLETLPENVDVVVINAEGTPEPLASQAAAEAVLNSDPFWCPDGTDPVGGGCTAYATFTDLLTGLQGVGSLTNGTVYVQTGVYGGSETEITFNGSTLTNIGNLTLIGGWDLAAATPAQVGVTTFHVPVSIINWTHNVSVQDIEIDHSNWNGLTINTTEQVSIDNVTTNNNVHDGIRIDAGDTIAMTNVQADHNGDDGIDISSNTNAGSISLENIQTNSNADDGVRIYSKQKSSITLRDVTSNYNGGDGLDKKGPLEAATCTYSEHFGNIGEYWHPLGVLTQPTLFVIKTCTSPQNQLLDITDSEFNYNQESGMEISDATQDIRIGLELDPLTSTYVRHPVYTIGNGEYGAYINLFPSDPGPFPWEYYQERAIYYQTCEINAGDPEPHCTPAQIFPQGQGMEPVWELGSLETEGNDYLHADVPSIFACGWAVIGMTEGWVCWADPSLKGLIGGETLNLGENDPNNDDVKPADTASPANSAGASDASSGESEKEPPLCSQNSIIILQLPNNDNVTVFCPISGQISVKSLGKKGLPGSVSEGITFVSAVGINLLKNGAPIQAIEDAGHLKVSFSIPADLAGQTFAILYWDEAAGQWVELPAFADNGGKAVVTDLGNGKQVLEGTKVLSDIGLVEASVNFPGIFILVTK